jgi:hypothetical protein
VDATVGATDDDEAAVRMLRRGGKPVILVANKVDNQRQEMETASLWSLGLGEPHPVSALHGRGSGDLLDAVLDALPERVAADPTRPIFVLVDRQSQKVFEALRRELPELPSAAIIAAIRFYNMDSRITMVLDALTAPAFAAMPLEKKQEMLEGHAPLLESAVDAAREAEKLLTAVASPGRGAAAAARPRS